MVRKSAGPGTAAAVAEAQKIDTLGPRIDRQAKSSPLSFQGPVAVYVGRECLGHIVACGKGVFAAFDCDDRSVGICPTQSGAAASLGGER